MGEGLIIGYDLCKDYCRISYMTDPAEEPQDLIFSDNENSYLIQNSICRKKGEEEVWLIGQEGYETALLGAGTIVDKLLRLVERGGSATFEGVRYTAYELLYHFLDETLKVLYKEAGTNQISQIVFSIQELNTNVLDIIISCARKLDIERNRIHVISHTESYLYYVLSQKRDLWSNVSALFDLSGDGLNYYEMEVLRGMQPNIARAERMTLEEGFSLDILENNAGRKMADQIMSSCVERMLRKKLISAVYLSGKGMDHCQEWGENFIKLLCQRRRVFFIENLFAKGASLVGCEYALGKPLYPFQMMCEGRSAVDIQMDVFQNMQKKTLTLAEAGTNWYDIKADFDLIPDQEDSIRMRVKKQGDRQSSTVSIPLSEFPERGNKRTRLNLQLSFVSENTFQVKLMDKGFGAFFPQSQVRITRQFDIF